MFNFTNNYKIQIKSMWYSCPSTTLFHSQWFGLFFGVINQDTWYFQGSVIWNICFWKILANFNQEISLITIPWMSSKQQILNLKNSYVHKDVCYLIIYIIVKLKTTWFG